MFIGMGFCTAVLLAFMAADPACRHWFVIPVLICGFLVSRDAFDWLLGRRDLLDPIGVVGTFSLYFFFLTPLLHVMTGYWMLYVTPPDDWRPWLGVAAILNCFGLAIYRVVVGRSAQEKHKPRYVWRLRKKPFWILLIGTGIVSLALEAYVNTRLGGVSGQIDSYMYSLVSHQDPLVNMGWIVVVSESFPVLMMLGVLVRLRERRQPPSLWTCVLMLVLLLGVQFFFGGFRGSRANTVWAVVWAVGALHLSVRRFGRMSILVGLLGIFFFIYLAGFYKESGAGALGVFQGDEQRNLISSKSHRDVAAMLLGDFARSDVQAFTVYRMVAFPDMSDPALGRTYLGDICLLIPRVFWPDRWPGKAKWTTELEYGIGSYGIQRSSRIYGLLGEAMLNFGPWVAPGIFILLGLAVVNVQRWLWSLDRQDSRIFLIPFAVLLCTLLLIFDLDNLIWVAVKFAAIPSAIVALSSVRILRPGPS